MLKLSLGKFLIVDFIRSANGLALPLGSNDVKLRENIEHRTCPENTEHRTCQVGCEEYSGLSFQKLDWTRQSVEPRTGIEFPMLLKENASRSNSEVLIAFSSSVCYSLSLQLMLESPKKRFDLNFEKLIRFEFIII